MLKQDIIKLAKNLVKKVDPSLLQKGLQFYIWKNPSIPKTILAVSSRKGNYIAFVEKEILKYNKNCIKKIILHELAHILSPIGSKHNYKWKQICLKIGGISEKNLKGVIE